MMARKSAIMGLLLLCAGSGLAGAQTANKHVGHAEISADGVLALHLYGVAPNGAIAHGYKEYKPDDPHYAEIKKHIGNIKPGEKKPIPPFPDSN